MRKKEKIKNSRIFRVEGKLYFWGRKQIVKRHFVEIYFIHTFHSLHFVSNTFRQNAFYKICIETVFLVKKKFYNKGLINVIYKLLLKVIILLFFSF